MHKRLTWLLAVGTLAISLPLGLVATTASAAITSRPAAPANHAAATADPAITARIIQHVTPLSRAQARALGLGAQAVNASESCWTDNFYMAPLWGASEGGSEDWCGDGSTITYAQAGNCYGSTSFPTWNYLGCTTTSYYGAGWDQAQQQVNWNICSAYIPWPSAACLHNQVNYVRLGFGPTGAVWTVSQGVL